MIRDMDLIRDLLLAFERSEDRYVHPSKITIDGANGNEIAHHVELLEDAGFLTRSIITTTKGSAIFGEHHQRPGSSSRITWEGYEFLEAIRDPEIWRKTKAGAQKVGGLGVDLLWGLAKEYVKAEVRDRLHIPLA